jgi:hypothetical protein
LHPQTVGLPQDALADCSRILANFYLQKYDKFAARICAEMRAIYFRYADDQMILLEDPAKEERVLLLLTRKLDRYGLRVNQKKVRLWKTPELEQHRCRSIQGIFTEKGDNQRPVLVRRFAKAYLKIPSDKLEKTWNGGIPLLNRLLWANLLALPQKSLDEIVCRLTSNDYLRLCDSKKLLRIDVLNKKSSRPIDLVQRLTDLVNKTVHSAFHHEVLVFARTTKSSCLRKEAKARLASLERLMNRSANL